MSIGKKEVKQIIGRFPDKMYEKRQMKSTHWKCSRCKKDYKSTEAIVNPRPCLCGSIFFTKEE